MISLKEQSFISIFFGKTILSGSKFSSECWYNSLSIKAGEQKTTIAISLADSLALLKKNVVACLREPSLGPVFVVKGGGAGGGESTLYPEDDINLHFTGDIHAITSVNNLIVALVGVIAVHKIIFPFLFFPKVSFEKFTAPSNCCFTCM